MINYKNDTDVISIDSILCTNDENRIARLVSKSKKLNLAFNIGGQIKIEGTLDENLIRSAVLDIVNKHNSLCSIFYKEEKNTYKKILPLFEKDLPLYFSDFSLDSNPMKRVKQQYLHNLNTSFNIFESVPWSFHLCKISEQESIGIFVAHHIISDFTSIILFGRELQYFYEERSGGTPSIFPILFEDDQQAIDDTIPLSEQSYKRYKTENFNKINKIPSLQFKEKEPLFFDRSFELGSSIFEIPSELLQHLKEVSKKENCTVTSLFLSAFQLQIQRISHQNKFVIGLPVDIRSNKKNRGALGYLSRPTFLSVDFDTCLSYRELILHNVSQIKKSVRRRFFPLSKLYQESALKQVFLPKVNVLFNHLQSFEFNDPACQTNISVLYEGFTHSDMDLWFTVQESKSGTVGKIEFSKDIFTQDQFLDFEEEYLKSLTQLCNHTSETINEIATTATQKKELVIAGTFTLNPLNKYMQHLCEFSHEQIEPHVQPYQQVFQTLLSESFNVSTYHSATKTYSFFIRLIDFYKHGTLEHLKEEQIKQNCDELIEAFRASIKSKAIDHHIIVCPTEEKYPLINKYTDKLIQSLDSIKGIQLDDLRKYAHSSIFNGDTNAIAHIPFENSFYKRLAYVCMQHQYYSQSITPKVIVLDCDNTLWKGIIGEDGLGGIEITEEHILFQEKILEFYHSGILIALSSKNNEQEVLEVLDSHSKMRIKREHIVTHRINWNSKAESILDIAKELNLGLDSFVFIDDNPVEIEHVQFRLPEVLSIIFPKEKHEIQSFIKNNWVINRKLNQSLFNRTQAYKEEFKRKTSKISNQSIQDFVKNLNLKVNYTSLKSSNIERANQLIMRTNQFNVTGEKIPESLLLTMVEDEELKGSLLSASDKYGDYGIIGLLLYNEVSNNELTIRNTILSCRVLGRGMEYQLCKQILQLSYSHQIKRIKFLYKDTTRNKPGLDFLQSLLTLKKSNDQLSGNVLELDVKELEHVSLDTFIKPATNLDKKKEEDSAEIPVLDRKKESIYLTKISSYLDDKKITTENKLLELSTTKAIEKLWLQAIDNTKIHPDVSFFSQGGTSLDAVYLLTSINQHFNLTLTIDEVYSYATFNQLNKFVQSNIQSYSNNKLSKEESLLESILKDIELSYEDVPFQRTGLSTPYYDSNITFITGATGFIGIHILKELIRYKINDQVICLVRSSTQEEALTRLIERANIYKIYFSEDERKRITCLQGDLELKKLGLSNENWDVLKNKVTQIIHCGAKVNFFESYNLLKNSNVESTRELLKLSVQGKQKQYIYISSTGVFNSEKHQTWDELGESFASGSPIGLPTGYEQSKWASEKLVARAIERGVPAQIIRLGTITGNSETDALNISDFFVHFLSSIYKIGAIPPMRPADFVPVNFVSKAVVKLCYASKSAGHVFHLVNPKPVSIETFTSWYKLGGVKLEILSYSEWLGKLKTFFNANPKDPFIKYRPLLFPSGTKKSFIELLLGAPNVQTSKTELLLSENGLLFPQITQELLLKYQNSYKANQLIKEDSAASFNDKNNLYWVTEKMNGFVHKKSRSQIKDSDYKKAFIKGQKNNTTCSFSLKGHVKSHIDLIKNKKVHLNGSIHCPAIHPEPLILTKGYLWFSPFDGYRPKYSDSLVLLVYRLECVSKTGEAFEVNGHKISKSLPNIFYETSEIMITVQSKTNPEYHWVGIVSLPFQQLFRDQIQKMEFRKGLTSKEKMICQIAWMVTLGYYCQKNYLKLFLRVNEWTWKDIKEYSKAIPFINDAIEKYLTMDKSFNRLGVLSKLIKAQQIKWLK